MSREPRARRHPLAALLLLLADAGCGLVVGYQVKETLRVASGNAPTGDAAIVGDGALGLVDFVFHQPAALTGIFATFAVTTAISVLVRPWTTLAYLSRLRGARPGVAMGRATMLYGRGLGITAALALVQGLVLGLFGFLAGIASDKLATRMGAPRADLVGLVILGLGGLFAVAIGAVRDLGHAALATGRRGVLGAFVLGLRTARRNAGSLALGYLLRTLASLALFALFTLGAAAAPYAVAAFLLRRAALLARGAAHVSWLSLALRAVERQRTAAPPAAELKASDTPSRTAEPPGPSPDPVA